MPAGQVLNTTTTGEQEIGLIGTNAIDCRYRCIDVPKSDQTFAVQLEVVLAEYESGSDGK